VNARELQGVLEGRALCSLCVRMQLFYTTSRADYRIGHAEFLVLERRLRAKFWSWTASVFLRRGFVFLEIIWSVEGAGI